MVRRTFAQGHVRRNRRCRRVGAMCAFADVPRSLRDVVVNIAYARRVPRIGRRPMAYRHDLGGTRHGFADLRALARRGLAAPLRRRTGGPRRRLRCEAGRRPPRAGRPAAPRLPRRASGRLRDRRGHAPHRRHARGPGVRAVRRDDRGRPARMAARARDRPSRPRRGRARLHAGDGGGGVEIDAQPGPRRRRPKMPGRHRLPHHARPAGSSLHTSPAQPSDR